MKVLKDIEERILLEKWLVSLEHDRKFARARYISSSQWRYRVMRLIECQCETYVFPCCEEEDIEFADFLDDNGYKVERKRYGDNMLIEVVKNVD